MNEMTGRRIHHHATGQPRRRISAHPPASGFLVFAMPIFVLTFVFAAAAPADAQDVSASISAIPGADGGRTEAEVVVGWNDRLSTSARLRSKSSTTSSEITGFDGSLMVSSSSKLEIAAAAIERRWESDLGLLVLGGGARFFRDDVHERGLFMLGDSNHQFDNAYTLSLGGPDLGIRGAAYLGPISASASVNVSPIGWYAADQTISITPLIETTGTTSVAGTTTMFTDASLAVTIAGIVRGSASVRTYRIAINLFDGGFNDDGSWSTTPTDTRTTETTLVGLVVVPLGAVGRLEVGGGVEFERYTPFEAGEPIADGVLTESRPIFNIRLTL